MAEYRAALMLKKLQYTIRNLLPRYPESTFDSAPDAAKITPLLATGNISLQRNKVFTEQDLAELRSRKYTFGK